jgi:hypothetical protein
MENPAFTGVSLSDIRVIMSIMHILVEELPCQALTGCIPALEYLLSGLRGCMWLHHVLSSIKWHHYPRTLAL